MKRFLAVMVCAVALLSPRVTHASGPVPPEFLSKLQWRSIGPYFGGRVVAVSGVDSEPNVFYMGSVDGGVWKSTDYGLAWENISDGKIPGTASSIGAIAVAHSNARVVYAGSGESDIRGDVVMGDGIYRSDDEGHTWRYAGLRETHTTSALAVDPQNPNVVYASSMGHVFKPNAERGVYKSTDGGKTWTKVLFVDDKTGAIDLVMDPLHPNTLYASMWQAQRTPWALTSGGPSSGLYKTVDGGAHWTNISQHPGFAHGVLGRMGITVAASDPRVVYAIVQAKDGGVFRSNDAGATWHRTNAEWKLRQRAFYYMSIYADPTNANVLYAPQVDGVFRSHDGGTTFTALKFAGDHHIVWINPHNPKILLEGDDGGATVSTDGGKTWSPQSNQPTGQFYHIALDQQFPFHVYGAAQDQGAYEGPSASSEGLGAGAWHNVAFGESTFVAPLPTDTNVTFGSGYFSLFMRQDTATGEQRMVSPWPRYLEGASAGEQRYRFGWTHPVFFSPGYPKELFIASQYVLKSDDEGETWKRISPDLTRDDKSTEGPSGGPIDLDQTSAEVFPDIASLAVSPMDHEVIWAGSADGLVHVTKDGGTTWQSVTPHALPQWAQISSIEPSHTDEGTAYLSASRYMWDDFHPYLFKTTDYGAHWTAVSSGIPANQYVFTVRSDPNEPNLLFAGTRTTVYVSFNGGTTWQSLASNLPGVQVRDIAIDTRQGAIAIATHGRAFWILDNLALLEQFAHATVPSTNDAALFAPADAWLSHAYGGNDPNATNTGTNPDFGATVFFNVPKHDDGKTRMTLSFVDAQGMTVRTFVLHRRAKHTKKLSSEAHDRLTAAQQRADDLTESTVVEPGMNRFQWDLRYDGAAEVAGFREPVAGGGLNDNVDGPTVVPGTYTVIFTYGTHTMQRPVAVALDPRLHPGDGALPARLALAMNIRSTLNELNTTINAALAARNHLPRNARAMLDHAIAQVAQLDIQSSEGDVVHETKLRDHLAYLAAQLDLSYDQPTAAQYAVYEDLRAEAAQGEQRIRTAMHAH